MNDVPVTVEPEEIRISVAIMHHPSRTARLPALVRACLPLEARPVPDPDPYGLPSPLRTAKRAWADIADGATHHLVLQDDAVPAEGFARLLTEAVAARPLSGLALYSNWNSPQNSYLVRRAVAAGSPWAPLSRTEWIPTQGFVLPVDQARDLAKYLAEIPDEVRDDDEMVALFCQERAVETLAAVPHLLDHADSPTIAGHPGSFHATVPAGEFTPDAGHWTADGPVGAALARRAAARDPLDFVVELTGSRCRLRFLRPGTGEPVEHPFGWDWYDWCALIGADAERIGTLGRRAAAGLGELPGYGPEVWAAGYLLGADAPGPGFGAGPGEGLLREAVGSWIDSGLRPADLAALTPALRTTLVDLGTLGVAAGRVDGLGLPVAPAPPPGGDHGLLERETAAHLRAAPTIPSPSLFAPPPPRLAVRVRTCPWCGAGEAQVRARPEPLPLPGALVLGPREEPGGLAVLTVLGCERPTARALLPLLADGPPAHEVRTRAVAWAEELGGPELPMDEAGLAKLLALLAATEQWRPDHHGPLTLPAATGRHGDPRAHPLGPHGTGPALDAFNRRHRAARWGAVAAGMGHPAP
ncbi:hypothetical protein ACWEQL_10790 [Kitasatospora sp. NPDC004240]